MVEQRLRHGSRAVHDLRERAKERGLSDKTLFLDGYALMLDDQIYDSAPSSNWRKEPIYPMP